MDYWKDVPELDEASDPKAEVVKALDNARTKANKLKNKKLKDKIWDTIGELLVDIDEGE